MLVQLWSCAVDDDRVQAHLVQVAKRGAKDIDVVGQNGTTDFNDSELLGGDRGELSEILLDLSLGGNVVQDVDNGGSSRALVGTVRGGILLDSLDSGSRDGEGFGLSGEHAALLAESLPAKRPSD